MSWIKIHRQLIDNHLWLSEPFTRAQAWIDLLLLAKYTDGFFYHRGIKVEYTRGMCTEGRVRFSSRWHWSIGKVDRFLNALQVEQQIIQHKSNVITLISIVNYNKYQSNEQQIGQQIEQQIGQQIGQQTDTHKKYKKDNKDKNKLLVAKATTAKIPNPFHALCKALFLSEFSPNYYWEGKDGKALNSLIDKIGYRLREAGMDVTEQTMADSLRAILGRAKEDKWIRENFSVSIINSKFNEITTKPESHHDKVIREVIERNGL